MDLGEPKDINTRRKMKLLNEKNTDKKYLFEQYRMFLQSASEISDRRQKANEYFLTANTILVSLIVFISQYQQIKNPKTIITFIAAVGLINSMVTYFMIRSYKQLNAAKFKIIHELEELLPARLYSYEWQLLGEGKNRKEYWPFSHLELKIPLIFGIVYLGLGLLYFVHH